MWMKNRMNKIRALVVDDEPFARERVRRLLAHEQDVETIGEAGDGAGALAEIKRAKPDLVFLDVQMPGKDGFAVLEELQPEETPVVIFLTAFDQYAVRAFDRAALDYVLKPFDAERFARAVARARVRLRELAIIEQTKTSAANRVETPNNAETPNDLAGEAESAVLDRETNAPERLDKIIIRQNGRVIFRRADEIDWLEAFGNYVKLHIGGRAYLLRETLTNLEQKLDPAKFARVHRSAIVQTARVREIRPQITGGARITLESGAQLDVSRRYRRRLPSSLR